MRFHLLVAIIAITVLVIAAGGAVTVGDGAETATSEFSQSLDNYAPPEDHLGSDDAPLVSSCAATPPEDYAPPDGTTSEVIGWVDGYWYNQPLDIDTDDGITPEELNALSARTAARFEALRCLTMEDVPPVEIIDRDEFRQRSEAQFDAISDDRRAFDNAMMATLLAVGHDEDSLDVRAAARSATVGGTYNFVRNEITIVTNNPEKLPVDEQTLAHELGHAIQNQAFDISRYNRTIHDIDKAKLGVIEGDVHLIQTWYLERCEQDRWNEPCLIADDEEDNDDNGSSGVPNWTIYFMTAHPYSDGTTFVENVYASGGWDAVNDLYEAMPSSSRQLTFPETYPDTLPQTVDIEDSSSANWIKITPENRPPYQVIGQGGISSIFMGAAVDEPTKFNHILSISSILSDGLSWFNYDYPASSGWQGDRLLAYENDDGDLGSVWKQSWKENIDVAHFVVAYRELIDLRGGERVAGYEDVYEFKDDSGFDMVVALNYAPGETTIVTAPSVEELHQIHTDIDLIEIEEPNDETDDGGKSDIVDDSSEIDDFETDDGFDGLSDDNFSDGDFIDTNDTVGQEDRYVMDDANSEDESDSEDDETPGFHISITVLIIVSLIMAWSRHSWK